MTGRIALADLYDPIYAHQGKDYDAECATLVALISARRPGAASLLDVGCGTGQHLARLRAWYKVEGADVDADMLRHARARLPDDVPLHRGDMVVLDLGRRFDVVTCLFSAIGYVRSVARLCRAIRSMAGHLVPGGLLVVEPWILPERWHIGVTHMQTVDEVGIKIARLTTSDRRGHLSVNDMHYLVATRSGVQHLRERLVMGLFSDEEYARAFDMAGLNVERLDTNLAAGDRGLYVGSTKV